MNNETKTGRGGARPNSGMKASGIETVTVRIDKRLLNTVTTIKTEFKDGNLNLDELFTKPAPKHDDTKLQKEYEALKSEHELFVEFSKERIKNIRNQNAAKIDELKKSHDAQIDKLIDRIEKFQKLARTIPTDTKQGNLDDKEIKRLIQFIHPDKHTDEESKKIATELTAMLNKLRG